MLYVGQHLQGRIRDFTKERVQFQTVIVPMGLQGMLHVKIAQIEIGN